MFPLKYYLLKLFLVLFHVLYAHYPQDSHTLTEILYLLPVFNVSLCCSDVNCPRGCGASKPKHIYTVYINETVTLQKLFGTSCASR